MAVVLGEAGLEKVTEAGPDTTLQASVRAAPVGSPSSATVPTRAAVAGNVTEAAPDTVTRGAVLEEGGFTVTVTCAVDVAKESFALSVKT